LTSTRTTFCAGANAEGANAALPPLAGANAEGANAEGANAAGANAEGAIAELSFARAALSKESISYFSVLPKKLLSINWSIDYLLSTMSGFAPACKRTPTASLLRKLIERDKADYPILFLASMVAPALSTIILKMSRGMLGSVDAISTVVPFGSAKFASAPFSNKACTIFGFPVRIATNKNVWPFGNL